MIFEITSKLYYYTNLLLNKEYTKDINNNPITKIQKNLTNRWNLRTWL